jgi:hypothetical protein
MNAEQAIALLEKHSKLVKQLEDILSELEPLKDKDPKTLTAAEQHRLILIGIQLKTIESQIGRK